MSAVQRCRDCVWYDVERVKDKAGRVRRNGVAPCLWVSSEPKPSSLWRQRQETPSWMQPYDGENCACFEPRAKETK